MGVPEELGVPDGIEPYVGWRAWALARTSDRRLELRPIIYAGEPWPAREVARAKCPPHDRMGHAPPEAECTCGLYAVDRLDRLPAVTGRDVTVIGSVAVWGRLIEHESGMRAEFAYPDRLRLICGPCWEAGTFTPSVTRMTETARGSLLGLCEHHATGQGGVGSSPIVIQQELLDTCAVDPMADESVRVIAEAWRHPVRRSRRPILSRVSLTSAAMFVLFFGTFLGLVALAMSVR